ncbi:GNAT family N-acetyltransferase [Segnochrobactrum spirostomi]|uniref:GNAT family N-acetyltransferase n=1 Tax=Segnochrobactrum spirostomi TaxID=2608987 RepID=UPI001AD7F6DE|nr:GNAT family protein [Segnochrobactrum spirostomi]
MPFLDAMIDLAFSMPHIERLELRVYTFNAPALRTYARLGFVPEGVWRSSIKVGAERWDTAIQSILRDEYRRMREAPRP